MLAPIRSMRARIVLMNIGVLAALFGGIGASIPPLVRSVMLRSIDRELEQRSERFLRGPGPGPRFQGGPNGPPGQDRFRVLPNDRPREVPDDPRRDRGPDQTGGPFRGESSIPRGNRSPEPRSPNDDGRPRYEGAPQHQGPRFMPPGPPEPPTRSGTVLFPRFIALKRQTGEPAPPAPWDDAAFQRATAREASLSTAEVDGEPIRVLSIPLPPNGPVEAVLQIPYPLAEVERAVSGLVTTLLTLAPLALLAAAAGGYALTGRALRPVARITAAAEQIGADDLGRRIQVMGQDEFGRLAATFNGMLGRLDLAFADRERLISQLREVVEQQRRFTADASHELKTPLTAIKANTSLLLSGTPTASEYREATREIDEAAGSMSCLVQDLLLLARSDAGQLVREPTLVPLIEPVHRAAAQVRKVCPAPITAEIPAELVVNGDEESLARLFLNLLDNAARHTPAEGSITVRGRREGDWVIVEAADTGAGIPPEHLSRLGERFYRVDTHRARAHGGTGLGLAISLKIARAHGGDLQISSAVGKGTNVTVRLPAADVGETT